MGIWKGVAERWALEGWEVIRMDFSHNGHVPPLLERCLDEEAWSSNRHHIERDEVAYALGQIDDGDRPVMVMGHSRGGAMAILGAERHMAAGGRLDGVSLWAPVSDLVSRFPQGEELRAWEASDRLEVVNGRTGQILVHPFGFYTDTIHRADELNLERAAKSLTCPVLAIHGTMDTAVHSSEGMRVAEWSAHGTFERVEGADHVFGMAHPWTDAGKWPEHLEEAWRRQRSWMKHLALI